MNDIAESPLLDVREYSIADLEFPDGESALTRHAADSRIQLWLQL